MEITEKHSGTKVWYFLTGEKIHNIARRLKVEVKKDGRGEHLDLTPHQFELTQRYYHIERSNT
jgi:hypothetical protein